MLAGKYRVTRVIGAGAMGLVVAAHHVQLDTKVAIKLLLPIWLSNHDAVARFAQEARAVAKMTSEHVARVLDVGTLETGVPFIVMEYLEGQDLAARLEERGPLEIEQAVEFIVQACVAVAEAHGLGIVHRDLKPANLFCIRRPDGQLSIKVLDFGISKLTVTGEGAARKRLSVTKNFEIMGSPLYMSPEQMKSSRHADPQSDVWALGVILYELISGELPFIGESEADVAINVGSQPPRPLRQFRPEVSPRLEGIILKCLEKERSQRYLNVADLACDLAPFAPARAWGAIERIAGTIEEARLSTGAHPAAASASMGAAEPEGESGTLRPPPLVGEPGAISLLGQSKPGTPHVAGVAVSRAAMVVATVLGLVVIGGAGVLLARTLAATRPATSEVAPAPATPSTSAATPPEAPAPVQGTATAAPPPTGLASGWQPVDAGPSPADHPTGARPSATPTTAQPRRAPGARPSPNCDVPYTLDSEGRKHFRPECFLSK